MKGVQHITAYNPTNGKILGTISGPQEIIELNKRLNPNPWVEGAHCADTCYVFEGEALERPVNPVQLNGNVLEGLPCSGVLKINSTEYPISGSNVTLEFDQPGTYQLTVSCWPHLDKEFVYENPAQ